jgi:hypothetical protein
MVRSLVRKAVWWMRAEGRTSETRLKHCHRDPRGSWILRERHDGVIVTKSNDRGIAVLM